MNNLPKRPASRLDSFFVCSICCISHPVDWLASSPSRIGKRRPWQPLDARSIREQILKNPQYGALHPHIGVLRTQLYAVTSSCCCIFPALFPSFLTKRVVKVSTKLVCRWLSSIKLVNLAFASLFWKNTSKYETLEERGMCMIWRRIPALWGGSVQRTSVGLYNPRLVHEKPPCRIKNGRNDRISTFRFPNLHLKGTITSTAFTWDAVL